MPVRGKCIASHEHRAELRFFRPKLAPCYGSRRSGPSRGLTSCTEIEIIFKWRRIAPHVRL